MPFFALRSVSFAVLTKEVSFLKKRFDNIRAGCYN